MVAEGDKAPEAPPSGINEQEKDVLHATRRQVAARKVAVTEALQACESQRQKLQTAIDEAIDIGVLRREKGELTMKMHVLKDVFSDYCSLVATDDELQEEVDSVIKGADRLIIASIDAIAQLRLETESVRSSMRSKAASTRKSPMSGQACSQEIEAQIAFVEEDTKLQEEMLRVQRERLKLKHDLTIQKIRGPDSDQEISSSDGLSQTSKQRTEQYIDQQYKALVQGSYDHDSYTNVLNQRLEDRRRSGNEQQLEENITPSTSDDLIDFSHEHTAPAVIINECTDDALNQRHDDDIAAHEHDVMCQQTAGAGDRMMNQ